MSFPPQYRSKKGRRPPFYLLDTNKHIDDIAIEDLELIQPIYLKPYEAGTVEGGIRRWNAEHEAVVDWLYEEGSPCLVDPNLPSQHSRYITEFAFAARNRGLRAILLTYMSLDRLLNCDYNFKSKYVNPWMSLTKEQQEETILKALSTMAREEELGSASIISRSRLLAPEITLANLCREGGKGLLDLLDLLSTHSIRPDRLSTEPIPNDKVFRKLGIKSEGDLPLSRGDRGLQEEMLMRRHSVLACMVVSILETIAGKPILSSRTPVGNVASDISLDNNPDLADSAEGLKDDWNHLNEESCCYCHLTARGVGRKSLLHCLKCKKVSRSQTYCSAACQKKDWPLHKLNCGSKLGSFIPIPIPLASTTSTPLHPLRVYVLVGLDHCTDEFWITKLSSMFAQGMDHTDKALQSEITQGMRRIAYQALKDDDPSSIAIIAFVVIRDISTMEARDETSRLEIGKGAHLGVEREQQFRQMFKLQDEEKWQATLAQGKKELLKPSNLFAKKLYRIQHETAKKQRDRTLNSLIKKDVPSFLHGFVKATMEFQFLQSLGLSNDEVLAALRVGDLEQEDELSEDEDEDISSLEKQTKNLNIS